MVDIYELRITADGRLIRKELERKGIAKVICHCCVLEARQTLQCLLLAASQIDNHF